MTRFGIDSPTLESTQYQFDCSMNLIEKSTLLKSKKFSLVKLFKKVRMYCVSGKVLSLITSFALWLLFPDSKFGNLDQ